MSTMIGRPPVTMVYGIVVRDLHRSLRQHGRLFGGLARSFLWRLLVAAPLRSVENFAAVINVVLFPLLFMSGALYPTGRMPLWLRTVARMNPVTYHVDLMRVALGLPSEVGVIRSLLTLLLISLV